MVYHARALIGLTMARGAADLIAASEQNPDDYGIREWIDYVESELRIGGQEGIDQHIIAAAFPEQLVERLGQTAFRHWTKATMPGINLSSTASVGLPKMVLPTVVGGAFTSSINGGPSVTIR